MVERMGGDMVVIDSEAITFEPTHSYVGAGAEPLVERFFPSVLRRLRAVGEKNRAHAGKVAGSTVPARAIGQHQEKQQHQQLHEGEAAALLSDCVVCIGRIEVRDLDLKVVTPS